MANIEIRNKDIRIRCRPFEIRICFVFRYSALISMAASFTDHLSQQLSEIRAAGLYKAERIITSPQHPHLKIAPDRPVLNLCANNYLGLADHSEVIAAARESLDKFGYG